MEALRGTVFRPGTLDATENEVRKATQHSKSRTRAASLLDPPEDLWLELDHYE